MAESRLIQKQLAGKEDLLLGIGTVKQGRASGIKDITRINATHFGGVLVVDTINDLNTLDKNQLDEPVVLVKEDGHTYIYNGTSWVTKTINIDDLVVENIEGLKALSSGIIEVLGYYEKGDGGGGLFYWDSESTEEDNGGTIIQATGVTTGRWKRVYSGAVNVKWFNDNIETIESNLSDSNIDLNGKTITTTTMPYKNSYYNGNININGKVYVKPKISKNYLWQGLFGTRRSSSFRCKDFRIPCYDGWTIATHTGVNAKNFYTVKTSRGIKIFRDAGSVVSDTVSLVANLPKKLSKELVGQGCFIKTKINKGIGYSGDVFLTVNASNYLEQPITNNIGTYTNGNKVIKNIELDETEDIIPCLISELYEQVAININISFSGSSSKNDYVEIEYVGLGLNNFFDVKKVDKDVSKKYIAMSYSEGMPIGSLVSEGSIGKVANTATISTDKVIHTQDIDLEWAITATCYDTLGNDLEMYDVNDNVSKYAMINNLSNKGFTIRNNQDITVGNKVLFHYVAEGVL